MQYKYLLVSFRWKYLARIFSMTSKQTFTSKEYSSQRYVFFKGWSRSLLLSILSVRGYVVVLYFFYAFECSNPTLHWGGNSLLFKTSRDNRFRLCYYSDASMRHLFNWLFRQKSVCCHGISVGQFCTSESICWVRWRNQFVWSRAGIR